MAHCSSLLNLSPRPKESRNTTTNQRCSPHSIPDATPFSLLITLSSSSSETNLSSPPTLTHLLLHNPPNPSPISNQNHHPTPLLTSTHSTTPKPRPTLPASTKPQSSKPSRATPTTGSEPSSSSPGFPPAAGSATPPKATTG